MTAATATIPFSVVDEAVHLLDSEAAPWSIQLEVRVGGHLDEVRLRAAFAAALAHHPMARARKVASSQSAHGDRWEIRPVAQVDPLSVVHCGDDRALGVVRAELQSLAVPLAEAPPLRAVLAHHPDGDALMLNVNHAAMDAFGGLRLLHSVAAAYRGGDEPPEPVDPLPARGWLDELTTAAASLRARRVLALVEKGRDLLARPARVAVVGATGEPGYGFHHVVVPERSMQALVDGDHAGTVNDVLLTALHLAIAGWNAEHGARTGRIGVLVPANLRPEAWRHHVAGNFSLPARLSTSARTRRRPQVALRAVTAQTRRKKKSGMGTALLELLRHSRRLPLWAKRALVATLPLTGNRLVDTAMLSNLGRLDEPPSFGAGAGPTVAVWFSPPARMPLGMALGAVTVGGRLHLAFRYRHRQFGADAARRFADRYLAELEVLLEGARPLAS